MKWLFAALLVLQAHFCAAYLVPLDVQSQGAFGGLLRWAWPWANGDGGPLGTVTTSSGFPVTGFFVAVTAAGLLLLAALAVVGLRVPSGWWRALAIAGAALSLFVMAMFFGPTKLLPMAGDLVVLWAALTNWPAVAARQRTRPNSSDTWGRGIRSSSATSCPSGRARRRSGPEAGRWPRR